MSVHNPRPALLSLGLATLLAALGSSIANVALPTLVDAFATTASAAQWVVLAYLLAITTLIVSAGRLGDLLGRKRVLIGGLLLFSAGSTCAALAPTLALLLAARALQGLGAAAMMALPLALVADSVGQAKAGQAMGMLGSLSAVGTALGPSLGGVLISHWGWRALFALCVPLALLAALLAWRYLPASSPASRQRPDYRGTLLLGVTLAAYALAMTSTPLLFVPAIFGAVLFVRQQRQTSAPLLQLTLFKDGARVRALLMSALVAAVMMSTLVVGPFYLSTGLALKASAIGLVMAAGPAMAAISGVPAGQLTDRFGVQRTLRAGLLMMALACLLLVLMASRMAVAGYIGPLLLMTAGYSLFQTANNTAVMAGGDTTQRGALSGVLNLARNLGLITGASALGAVFISASAATDAAHGLRVSFAVALALVLAALASSVRPQAAANAT
ncbi:MAG: MFS transporter [Pseudomonas sp.]